MTIDEIPSPRTWRSNGIGEPMCTGWLGLDEEIGSLLAEAGPTGWTEFGDAGVRLWKPFRWDLGG